jgi:hypothetical protein
MGGRSSVFRISMSAILLVLLIAACAGDGDDPTATVPPPTPTATTEPTPTQLPPTSTPEPTATSTQAPTATTQVLRPTPTIFKIVTPTPTLSLEPTPGSGGVVVPEDLLLLLPVTSELPEGMEVTFDQQVGPDQIANDLSDPAAYQELLTSLGFQNGAMRDFEIPDGAAADPNNQLLGLFTSVVLFGSNDAAAADVVYYVEDFRVNQPQFGLADVPIDPLGDLSLASYGTAQTDDGNTFAVTSLVFQAGPLSVRYTAISGTGFDALPLLVQLGQVTLLQVEWGGAPDPEATPTSGSGEIVPPALGDELFYSDLTNFATSTLESGTTFIADNEYHVQVVGVPGSYINVYTNEGVTYTDFAVSVDLRLVADAPAALGCVLARLDQVSGLYDYALCFDGAGNITAMYEQVDSEGQYSSENLLAEPFTLAGSPFDWHTLTIFAQGSNLWFAVDGDVFATTTHVGPPGGDAGFSVINYGETTAEFAFSNLTIYGLQ